MTDTLPAVANKSPEWVQNGRMCSDEAIAEEIASRITNNYRVIPEYSKAVLEHGYLRRYSMRNCDLLRRQWESFKDEWLNKNRTPMSLPDRRDEHFYNYKPVYRPEESIHKKGDFRMKLKPGPGVDSMGHIPIPDEFMIKRRPGTTPAAKPRISSDVRPIQNRNEVAGNECPCEASETTKNDLPTKEQRSHNKLKNNMHHPKSRKVSINEAMNCEK